MTKLANLFGEPGKGFHKARFLGLARNDLIATVIVAGLLAWWLDENFFVVFILLFILGEITHAALGVRTAFLRQLSA